MPPKFLLPLIATLTLTGCAVNGDPRDPIEPVNRAIHSFNEGFDRTILKPVAKGYQAVTPEFAQTSIRNFFANLDDVTVLANDILQLKLEQTTHDFLRLTFNSTFGMLGLFDVAADMGLQKHNEDFGQTLGRWGAGSGPYLVMPFLGPSDLRDMLGFFVDGMYSDLLWNLDDNSTRNLILSLRLVARRADLLEATQVVDEAALDNYEFTRDFYLERRRGLIYDGNPPLEQE
jgi:phospholipid-binding lipoprotein MlaA